MPIQLTCPTCGKKLQIGDQYAGRRVGCPGCKSVITAPGCAAPAAPAAPPPAAPKPAAPPPAVAKAPPAAPKIPAAPARTAPPREEPAPAVDDNDFDFGSKRQKPEDLDDAPPAKPKGRDKPPASKPAAAARKRGREMDDDDDLRPPGRSRRDSRADTEEEKHYSSKTWQSFAGGSGLAKVGLWIEFLALTYFLLLVGYIYFSETSGSFGRRGAVRETGPWIFLPLFVGSFVGVLMSFAGRTKMMSIPQGTGAKRVFLGAWLFTLLRFFAAIAGLVFSILASVSDTPGDYLGFAFLGLAIGLPLWALADLSSVPAMAIVGGVMPSRNLRRASGRATFALQIIVLIYILLIIGFYFYDERSSRRYDSYGRRSGLGDEQVVMGIILGVSFVLQLIYTLVYSALYSAGSRALAALQDAEDRAGDEEF